jgi:hypothetical protein
MFYFPLQRFHKWIVEANSYGWEDGSTKRRAPPKIVRFLSRTQTNTSGIFVRKVNRHICVKYGSIHYIYIRPSIKIFFPIWPKNWENYSLPVCLGLRVEVGFLVQIKFGKRLWNTELLFCMFTVALREYFSQFGAVERSQVLFVSIRPYSFEKYVCTLFVESLKHPDVLQHGSSLRLKNSCWLWCFPNE